MKRLKRRNSLDITLMTKKFQIIFQIIIYSLVIIGVMGGILSTQVVAAPNQCLSVEQIYKNIDLYDGQNVTLIGKVVNLTLSVSASGNKYTTFMLDDATAAPLKVFSYTHLSISEGDTVKVSGTFHEVLWRKDYTFYMEIITTPEEVSIVESLLSKLLPVIITIFVIAVLFIIYKKYKQHKISKDGKYEAGKAFEAYVLSLFDMRDWSIVDYTKDLSKKIGRKVESDSNPDLVMRHKDTNKVIAIECKYRSGFVEGTKGYGITWAPKYQIKNYNAYREKTNYPVFAIIGIGGSPAKPKSIFTVPLYRLKYSFAFEDYLNEFERSSQDKFTIEEFKKLDTKV